MKSSHWLSVKSLGTGAAAVAAFWVAFGGGRLFNPSFAEQPATPVLTLGESRVYTLSELTGLMRNLAGVEVYADRRNSATRVFVSQGTYEVSSLVEAVRLATGLNLRQIREMSLLAPRDLTFGDQLAFPLMSKPLLQRLGKELRPISERVDLRQEGIPFETMEFLARKSIPFEQLTQKQQKFVVKTLQFINLQDIGKPGLGRLGIDDATLQQRLEELRDAQIRLGTSFLMAFTVDQPAPSPTKPDTRVFSKLFQVYYDYRDRLGITLPEE